jgi:hypothetical protein
MKQKNEIMTRTYILYDNKEIDLLDTEGNKIPVSNYKLAPKAKFPIVYKIYNSKLGKYSKGGQETWLPSFWNKSGKSWNQIGHLKNHLAASNMKSYIVNSLDKKYSDIITGKTNNIDDVFYVGDDIEPFCKYEFSIFRKYDFDTTEIHTLTPLGITTTSLADFISYECGYLLKSEIDILVECATKFYTKYPGFINGPNYIKG